MPQYNKYVYWLKKPVGWVVCAAFGSLLVGLFVAPQGWVLFGSLVTLLALGVVWPWLSMKGLDCKLYFEQSRSEENQSTRAILEVTNCWPVPAFGLMVGGKFLQHIECEDDVVAVGLKRVPAWSKSRFEWIVEPRQRGRLPVDVPELITGFPFGLYNASKPVKVAGETIVWPSCEKLEGIPEIGGAQFNIDGLASDRPGNDGESIGVRDYRQGDSIKNIHWSQTARTNRLIVRERQSLMQTPIRVIVDLTFGNHFGTGTRSSFEWAIRIAASVCRQLHVHQAHVELQCFGLPAGIANQSTNRNGLKPLLDFLALLPHRESLEAEPSNRNRLSRIQMEQNRFTILIQTTSTDVDIQSEKSLRRICIGPDGFVETDELTAALAAENHTFPASITSPDLAGIQLGQYWQGGVHAG